jgi:catechol 2,3-dioxygenase-like lactoylglutathione lyase family enzyme
MKLWSGVITQKVQESKDFYVRIFGFEVIYEGEGGWFVLLQLGAYELGFMLPGLDSQAAIFRSAHNGKGMWLSFDVEDVDAQYQRIQSLGVPIEVALRNEPWGDRHFVIVDPSGIALDIVQRDHS